MRNYINKFDRKVGSSIKSIPKWAYPIMQFFTLVGQPPFTIGVAAAILGYGYALDKDYYLIAGFIAITTITVSSVLKIVLRRSRPVNQYVKNMFFKTFSFPSGHAAGSLVSYGLAAIVISYKWPELAIATLLVAIIVIFFVGLSRVYLGAHYASDVIGGWIVGLIGVIAIILLDK